MKELHLGNVAEVLRCQLPRHVIPGEQMIVEGMSVGELRDNKFLAMEIRLDDFDRETRFVPCDYLRTECVTIRLAKANRKYLLKKNDILVSCIGRRPRLGIAGFAACEMPTSVPSRNLCVIRPFDVDPVFLFYRLMEKDAEEFFTGKAKGAGVMAISLEEIRAFTFTSPSNKDVELINAAHKRIVEQDMLIQNGAKKIKKEQLEIHGVFLFDRQKNA